MKIDNLITFLEAMVANELSAELVLGAKPFVSLLGGDDSAGCVKEFVKVQGMVAALEPKNVDSVLYIALTSPRPGDSCGVCGEIHEESDAATSLEIGMVGNYHALTLMLKTALDRIAKEQAKSKDQARDNMDVLFKQWEDQEGRPAPRT